MRTALGLLLLMLLIAGRTSFALPVPHQQPPDTPLPTLHPGDTLLSGLVQISITETRIEPSSLVIGVGTQVLWYNTTGTTVTLRSGLPGQLFLPVLVQVGASTTTSTTISPAHQQRQFQRGGPSAAVGGDIVLPASGVFGRSFDEVGVFHYFLAGAPHRNGSVRVRELPGASTPTASSTPTPPTLQPTHTATPQGVASPPPTYQPTPTATGTGLLPTLTATPQPTPTATATPDTRPNIIVIYTDDQDAASVEHMPSLQQFLAQQGISFSNSFVTTPLCCPSRASYFRGQYVHNHRVLGNGPPLGGYSRFRDLGLEQSTIATWLQDVGYRTVLIGKFLNGYPNTSPIPPGWDEWYSTGAAAQYGYSMNRNGTPVLYGHNPADYQTDVCAGLATDFITRTRTTGQPFFMHLALVAPHAPFVPAPRHSNAFQGVTIPRTPAFNEADVSDKPEHIQAAPLLTSQEIAQLDADYRNRLRMLLAVDEALAAIVDTLRAAHELDTTYIFFTSDNGYLLGEHRLHGKVRPYEASVRVPLLVRGPGVAAGAALPHLVLNIDLAPTIAELAGAEIPAFVDGQSLVPLLQQNPPSLADWRQVVLLESEVGLRYQGLRSYEQKYVEYPQTRGAPASELYDLTNDPYEVQSLHAVASLAHLRSLSVRLRALKMCGGQHCRDLQATPLSTLLPVPTVTPTLAP